MPENRSIPWRRIGAEVVAIVVSILLAFAIDAWWDLRGDRQLEQEYLVALEAEVHTAISELENDLEQREMLRAMLVSYLTDEQSDRQFFSEMLYRSAIVNNLSPPTSVIDELISSGQLQLIRSAQIREGLVLYRQMMQKNDLNDEGHRTFVNTRFIPFLSERIPLAGVVPVTRDWQAASQSISDQDIVELRNDTRFVNILIERLQHLDRGLPRLRSTTNHLAELSELFERALD